MISPPASLAPAIDGVESQTASPHDRGEIRALVDADDPSTPVAPVQRIAFKSRAWANISLGFSVAAAGLEWLFGALSLIVLLAVVATIPIVQFASLGYLLEVSGRVARTGRLRDGFIGVPKAAQLGGVLLGLWLLTLPLRVVATLWAASELIDPQSRAAFGWRIAFVALSVACGVHALGAILRGARLRQFLTPRPLKSLRLIFRRDSFASCRDGLWDFIVGLRAPSYFWLGLRGFCGTWFWLAIPVSLLAVAKTLPAAPGRPPFGFLVGLVGGLLLMFIALRLPLTQAGFAMENRWGALFNLRRARRWFARAPLATTVAVLATLALSLPLLLLKIEMVPREAAWLPSLLFVFSALPARLLSGWALARALRRESPRHWFWRLVARLILIPAAAIYSLLVFGSQYLSWHGVWSLYEQHAFLVPAPFLGF
jgi:hypothetical protein